MSDTTSRKIKVSFGWKFLVPSVGWFFSVLFFWFVVATKGGEGYEISFQNGSWSNFKAFFSSIDLEFWKNFGYFVGTLGIGPIAIYLASIRTKVATEQLETEQKKLTTDKNKTEIDREKMVNENFTTSVELLGNKSAAVRQGGVYSLQRLLKESDLYPAIIRIVTSFVRARSVEITKLEAKDKSTIDIESALFVIRERKSREQQSYETRKLANEPDRVGFIFDMSQSEIEYVDLDNSDFRGFNLSDCSFKGCTFINTNFGRAALVGTDFGDAVLTGAILKDADISGNDSTLNVENRLCDLSQTIGLTQKQINQAYGNDFTKLPNGLTKPAHWGKLNLN